MIRFAHSEYLYALALLPALAFLFWWAARMQQRALKTIGNPDILNRLIQGAGRHKREAKFLVLTTAYALIVLGLANPQIGTKLEEVKREGVDIFIALDVSSSMKAEDIRPNRLESAKQQVAYTLDRLQNDQIGLIVFAGDSYLQLPLTTDYGAARLFLSTIDVDVVPVPGTAIGSAIRLAMKSFVEGERKHKVIVVITDGENHEDNAIAAANAAEEDGVIVHTIGMGSIAGAPIPIYQNNAQAGFKRDREGGVVLTKLDQVALQQIADAGHGKFVIASNQSRALDEIFREIESMEKKEFGAKVFTEYEDRFQIFLAVALLLLLFEFFLSERRNKWLAKWKMRIGNPLTMRSEKA